MMLTLLLIACALSLTAIYFRVKPRFKRVGPFLPDSFLIGLAIYAIGAVYVVHAEQLPNADRVLLMSGTALLAGLAGSILFSILCGRAYRGITFADHFASATPGPKERLFIYGLLTLSAVVCVAFVFIVLSNSIVGALLSVASLVTDSTLLEARKAITSGSEGYFAPGYIKQFRDIIIPILVIAVMAMQPTRKYKLLSLGALGAAGLAMVLSGQRLVFVVLFLTLMLGAFYVQRNREAVGVVKRRSAKLTTFVALGILALMYGGLTMLLGRTEEGVGAFGAIWQIAANLLERIFVAPPHENTLTYAVWHSLGPTWGGSWLADLGGILPGAGESFSNLLHSASGGSLQGNSPLGLPADVWFAWGWAGCIVVPFLYAFGIGWLDMLLLTERSPVFFGTRCYLFVALPICYSPFLFILYGGAVAAVLIVSVKLIRWRKAAPQAVAT